MAWVWAGTSALLQSLESASASRALLLFAAASFHVLAFLLMGPNFGRQLMLVLVAQLTR